MGLAIYESPNPDTAFSTEGIFTKPLTIAIDGAIGGTFVRRYYLRNDAPDRYWTNIEVKPLVLSGTDIVSSNGFSWKLIAGDSLPLEEEWDLVSAGNTISLSNIGSSGNGDTTTYLPFWLRIEVSRGVDVQSFENVTLEISSDENSV